MTTRVGVIGTGNIGTFHVNTLATRVSGAEVTAVFDVDTQRAKSLADDVGARSCDSAEAVIARDDVDALLLASPGALHPQQVLACLEADKPVLCEKPLGVTTEECLFVLEAEVALGRQLIQLGFMRRYDPGYLQVKAALDGGHIGDPLMLHCVHRNPTVPPSFNADMAITDSVVHEIDTSRWLLGEEITAITVLGGRTSRHASAQDPQLVLFETESGVIVDLESFVNCQYGYDVRCELVGSDGVVNLDNPTVSAVTAQGNRSTTVPADWQTRFGPAYVVELQAWIDGVGGGRYTGASAWDGYATTAVATAGLRARATGDRVEITLVDKPSLYDGACA
ncbi:MAG: inositol 2-dehydrogenase [Nocardioidaceae bacterium]|nr:inositol 2-dehydrogenase [Nocardioidaceae bacterium]